MNDDDRMFNDTDDEDNDDRTNCFIITINNKKNSQCFREAQWANVLCRKTLLGGERKFPLFFNAGTFDPS